jgi:hypothetical protein
MDTVNRYQIRIPGLDPAKQRASISLLGSGVMRSALGRVHFYDEGQKIPADTNSDGIIDIHLPLAAFAGVVAMLQHDSPVKIDFQDGRGHLWTGEWEKVGETESLR